MVLTPRFHLSQSEAHVLVHINLPNIRVSGLELVVLGRRDVSFYCRPYLLRLELPGDVYGDEEADESKRPKAQYDPEVDNGTLTVRLLKVHGGQHFEGLDMISNLLKVSAARPRVGTGRYGLGVDGQGAYGFLNGFKDFFGSDGFLEAFPELIDLPHPDETSKEMRSVLREVHEDAMFSGERYRADFFLGSEDYLYSQAMAYEPPWTKKIEPIETSFQRISIGDTPSKEEAKSILSPSSPSDGVFVFGTSSSEATVAKNANDSSNGDNEVLTSRSTMDSSDAFFSEDERRQMQILSTSVRDFSQTENEVLKRAPFKIIDVLLAYCYENRFCAGEWTCESHWTLRKLSGTLSWLEDFDSLDQVFRSFARRCLSFPYLRRWDLCCRAAMDCADLLNDQRWVVKALLKVQSILNQSQTAYLLNKLFVDDMCVFVQDARLFTSLLDIFATQNQLRSEFDLKIRIPSPELIGWNLAKASSRRPINAESLKSSHLQNIQTRAHLVPEVPNTLEDLD